MVDLNVILNVSVGTTLASQHEDSGVHLELSRVGLFKNKKIQSGLLERLNYPIGNLI